MTLTEYKNKRTELEIEGTGVDTVTTADRHWNNKTTGEVSFTIPAGSHVHVDFSPKKHSSNIFVTVDDQVKVSRIVGAHKWLKGFRKPPTMNTIQKYDWNGIAKTVTGKKVEPDGYSYDGSPSWMLVVGII